ncbi:cysteine--tRNA ligase, chloroplastic/mitochondrial-like isoform X2 [Typha angustifolia]|uniref:cysteine--tRNA ligase, chloroplastic/mitochondrial-like isoform X2 n=1 Tax=Typha angustifolia TaxID=59011 RepID=UPI003C2FB2EB
MLRPRSLLLRAVQRSFFLHYNADSAAKCSTIAMESPSLRIYNSKTKKKEVFVPKHPGKVGMYVCGLTPYALAHIGNARVYVVFDVLYRYLRHLGYDVTYVRNFTDIDDKIISKANEKGEDPLALSHRFSEEFHQDREALQCLPPTHEPRVSDYIEHIKDLINQIIKNGYAYAIGGDVYFSTDEFPNYGLTFGQKREAKDHADLKKKNKDDFALWKSAKVNEPYWDSPWGAGRPGWHIECSAMSTSYLSSSFDIHGGGMDLQSVHHENEIAQNCAAFCESNVSYWMHINVVRENGKKISKSELTDGSLTIREIIKSYHPLSLRYYLISAHYRSEANYSARVLDVASDNIFYIFKTLQDCEEAVYHYSSGNLEDLIPDDVQTLITDFRTKFQASMSDDLKTAPVLKELLMGLLTIVNTELSKIKEKRQQQSFAPSISALAKEIKNHLVILGLMPPATSSEVVQQLKDKALARAGLTEDQVLEMIEERQRARLSKQFSKSDSIRDYLSSLGFALMDEGEGSGWKPSLPSLREPSTFNGHQ